jgi:hypothetical protein
MSKTCQTCSAFYIYEDCTPRGFCWTKEEIKHGKETCDDWFTTHKQGGNKCLDQKIL